MNKEKVLEQIKKTNWYKQAANVKSYFIFKNCRSAAILLDADLAVWSIREGKLIEWYSPKESFNNKQNKQLRNRKRTPYTS